MAGQPRSWSMSTTTKALLAFVVAVGLLAILFAFTRDALALPLFTFTGCLGAAVAWSPYRLSLWDDGTLEVAAFVRTVRTNVRSIHRIDRAWGQRTGFRIHTDDQVLRFPFSSDGSYDLFKALEASNPSIEFSRV
jgi:hypothetical protein